MPSDAQSAPDLRPHGYQATRLLGQNFEGGRLTWLGHRLEKPDDQVVIKQFSFLNLQASWRDHKSHLRELDVLERLDDPRIPEVLEHFQTEDGLFLVQRFCPAPNLSQIKTRWSPHKVMDLAAQMLEVLDLLHGGRPMILHRDIKPQNILWDEAASRLYLVDFGLGRIGASSGASSVAIGTPGYMAPEQMVGQEVDERSDLYGLGMTCVVLLSGLAEKSTHGLLDVTMQVNLEMLDTRTPQGLKDWLLSMTSPLPSRRPASAALALTQLQLLMQSAPLSLLEAPPYRPEESRSEKSMVPHSIPWTPSQSSPARAPAIVGGSRTHVAPAFTRRSDTSSVAAPTPKGLISGKSTTRKKKIPHSPHPSHITSHADARDALHKGAAMAIQPNSPTSEAAGLILDYLEKATYEEARAPASCVADPELAGFFQALPSLVRPSFITLQDLDATQGKPLKLTPWGERTRANDASPAARSARWQPATTTVPPQQHRAIARPKVHDVEKAEPSYLLVRGMNLSKNQVRVIAYVLLVIFLVVISLLCIHVFFP